MRELEARIRNLHRRTHPPVGECLEVGELRYDPATMQATRGDRTDTLTAAQARLLEALMRRAPAIVPHEALLRAARGGAAEGRGDAATLHTLIYELRAIVDRPHGHAMIRCVHGVGYRLQAAA
jgi:DNA-binding response OmpR family regulator